MTKTAFLIKGTFRELDFILQLMPYMCKKNNYDIFIVIREVKKDSLTRIKNTENNIPKSFVKNLPKNCYIQFLPEIQEGFIDEKYLHGVGPDTRESQWISMFNGIFAGVQMIKSACVKYDYVIKSRTDYILWLYPWIEGFIKAYNKNDQKIIIDGNATHNWRYPLNNEVPWQGSISDIFSFSNYNQFLSLWDFDQNLNKFWTGVGETTLFRSIFNKYLNDDVQSPRKNLKFLQKYFYWKHHDRNLSKYILYKNIITKNRKKIILGDLSKNKNPKFILNDILSDIHEYWEKNAIKKF